MKKINTSLLRQGLYLNYLIHGMGVLLITP